tara:strand:- start:15 stop:629 length:615 start_codon:yes stop_codon:yes gene_type:complete
MKRIKVSEETNFIGCWNLNEKNLCSEIIDLFEKNKILQKRGTTALGVDEKLKKSIDITIQPKDLNKDEFKVLKKYVKRLFECYQDYKILWPFLDKTFASLDIPAFNIQKYEKGGHFASTHCERGSIPHMHRVFAWMTYLNDVDSGGETYFEHFNLKIKPEIGKTLIWPAEWTHAHKGEVLNSGLKYIITGWMHLPFNFQVPQKV